MLLWNSENSIITRGSNLSVHLGWTSANQEVNRSYLLAFGQWEESFVVTLSYIQPNFLPGAGKTS